tara:strand:+ start:1200 stop:1736 length:537 start_codon:yes stop_codon:yes gene_type:complete
MKLTTKLLKKIIKEELQNILFEAEKTSQNLSDWIEDITDEDDKEDLRRVARRVKKGRMTEEEFTKWVREIVSDQEKAKRERDEKERAQEEEDRKWKERRDKENEKDDLINNVIEAARERDNNTFNLALKNLGLSGLNHEKFANDRIDQILQILNNVRIHSPLVQAANYVKELMKGKKA